MPSTAIVTSRLLRGLLIVVGLAACNGPTHGIETPAEPTRAASEGGLAELQRAWVLISLQDPEGPVTPVDEGKFTADFGTDGDLFIGADCNVCSAGYTASPDGAIEVTHAIPCTRAYCPSAPLDARYLTLLKAARSWSIGSAGLELSSAAGSLLFQRATR
jgi:heat shock protein HslJ